MTFFCITSPTGLTNASELPDPTADRTSRSVTIAPLI